VKTTPVGRPFTRPAAPPITRTGSGPSRPDSLHDDFGAPTGKPTIGGRPGSGVTGNGTPSISDGPGGKNQLDLDRRRRSFAGDTNGRPPSRDRIVGNTLSGVSLQPTDAVQGSANVQGGSGNTTIINDNSVNDNSVNYITNVTYANNSWHHPHGGGHHWQAPLHGSHACWDGWDHDGFSIGVGFGSGGFSFGLFYSSWGSPLCSSWCDPWWDGWCSSVVVHCPPRYRWARPCWSPCGSWYTNYIVYREVPATWCTPVYAWTPTYAVPSVTTINNYYDSDPAPVVSSTVYTQPATTLATGLPVSSPAEAEAWDLLSNGFPRSSADTFAKIHDSDPNNNRSLVGYAISLAMLEDISGSASVMRQALATDPGLVASLPMSQQLVDRVRLLEQSAEVASRQAAMSRDALFLLGSWRAMQGRFTEAHLAVLNAQQAGEQSLAAARLRSWLEGRMTSPI
jgi:hypothetical protein